MNILGIGESIGKNSYGKRLLGVARAMLDTGARLEVFDIAPSHATTAIWMGKSRHPRYRHCTTSTAARTRHPSRRRNTTEDETNRPPPPDWP